MRSAYTEISEWRLFDDTRLILEELQLEGWTHAILSNHVPELPSIIEGLGIRDLFVSITNSAETGFEKPHPRAFQSALATLHNPTNVWMIGDNIHADVLGAESAGIKAILIRNEDERVPRATKDLAGVRQLLREKKSSDSRKKFSPGSSR
jgi:putative hydrolase of the HAD superfamily